MVNMNASYPILSGLVKNRAFNGQNVQADPKKWKIQKNVKNKKFLLRKDKNFLFYTFFSDLSIFGVGLHILAFKSSVID